MPPQVENRLIFQGIDSDSAPQLIDDKSLINAVNIRAITNDAQTSGDIQFITGNTSMFNIGDVSEHNKLIGKATDEEAEVEYLFFYSSVRNSIYKFEKQSATFSTFFIDTFVIGGLGFTEFMYISAKAANGLLIWTDGVNPPRYLNTTRTYNTPAITQAELSLITEPPVVPLAIQRITNNSVTTNIQETPIQGAYRFINKDNFTSVISPYSLTALPVRQSELNTNSSFGNTINFTVDFDQKIPENWKTIEFIARYTDTNVFYVIKQFSSAVAADVTAVNAHNNGITQLSFNGWDGSTIYTVDPAEAAKQQDAIPRTSEHLEEADNRLFLANNLIGYNTPLIVPGYSLATSNYTTDYPTGSIEQAYIIVGTSSQIVTGTSALGYFAFVIRKGGKNYLLPKDYSSVGSYTVDTSAIAGPPPYNLELLNADVMWNLPYNISIDYLIELKESGDPVLADYNAGSSAIYNIRQAILVEANGIGTQPPWLGTSAFKSAAYHTFNLMTTPNEYGTGGESRAFSPNDYYNFGIQYYDGSLRKSGVEFLQKITVPAYGPYSRSLQETIDFTINNTVANAIPNWAQYFSITATRFQKSIRQIDYIPDTIKVAVKDFQNDIKLFGNSYLATPGFGFTVYGLAIPITSVAKYGYGYTFTQGDFIELIGYNSSQTADTSVISGSVLTTFQGYVIISYDSSKYSELDDIVPDSGKNLTLDFDNITNDGTVVLKDATFRQNIVFATLHNGIPADPELYEVAKFGSITNPGTGATFGKFYDSNTLTTTILGDTYTQKRTSATGAGTDVSITTYEINNLIPVNDTGRITPTDQIGQKRLPTQISWSNTNIPGTNTNGYASFDAADYRIIEQATGEINSIITTQKGVQDGAQMVILCANGSYTALIGKQQLYSADQSSSIVQQTTEVLGTINPLRGGWGCRSPRSVVRWESTVWWVDWYNQVFVEFNSSGAEDISSFKAIRLAIQLLSRINTRNDVRFITSGLNPANNEVLFFVPCPSPTNKTALPSVPDLENPIDSYYNKPYTYVYNWDLNRWVGAFEQINEFFNIGYDVYSVLNGINDTAAKLYSEFTGEPGVYNGLSKIGMAVIPFNAQYPMVKSALAVRVSATRPPDTAWITTTDAGAQQVAGAYDWAEREGDMCSDIRNNRLSNNASNDTEWSISGITGNRLKGKIVFAVLIWDAANGGFTATSGTLEYSVSKGH